MIYITEKLYNKKIVLISLLKSKGIYNSELFAKIVNSNKRQLNLIHANYIKGLHINIKSFFKHIIKDAYFRNKTTIHDKITILTTEINKILKSRYYNNKSNIIFQNLIKYLLDLLGDPKVNYRNTHLTHDLMHYIKDKYFIENKTNVISEIRKAGKYTLEKLKLVGELIDQIDYLNFLNNEITTIEILRMGKNKYNNQLNYTKDVIDDLSKSDKDLNEIYKQLTTHKNKIQTKLLYNKLVDLKTSLHQRMHEITYGIDHNLNQDKIESMGNTYYKGYLPFSESGILQISDQQFRNLHINTIYFKKSNQKSIRNFKNGYFNNQKIKGKINIIFEGVNPYNKGRYRRSYIIQYQYITTSKQNKQFRSLMQSLKKSITNDIQYNKLNNFKDYIECSYSYPFINQNENFKAFRQYYKEISHTKFNVKYRNLYPYINRSTKAKNKFLSFTSYKNNIWRDFLLRKHIDRNLANIFYILDLDREITNFYNPKNQLNYTKRQRRLFIAKLITKIQSNKDLFTRFKKYLDNLTTDYNRRIYLFQLYGIDALKNQIADLGNFYNTNFKYKWNNDAKDIKLVLRSLKKQLRKRKSYMNFILMQKFKIDKFKDNLNPHNVLMHKILHQNIEKYLRKTLIRKITTHRSKVECILMACNNLESIQVKFMDIKPVYIKEEIDGFNKFDELLGTSEITKIEYINAEKTIDLIALFKCIVKFDRYFDLTDLFDKILNIKIDDHSRLRDYIYKEKSILNQL